MPEAIGRIAQELQPTGGVSLERPEQARLRSESALNLRFPRFEDESVRTNARAERTIARHTVHADKC